MVVSSMFDFVSTTTIGIFAMGVHRVDDRRGLLLSTTLNLVVMMSRSRLSASGEGSGGDGVTLGLGSIRLVVAASLSPAAVENTATDAASTFEIGAVLVKSAGKVSVASSVGVLAIVVVGMIVTNGS